MKSVKKIRKSTKYICIIIALALMLTCVYNLFENIFNTEITKTEEIYYFTNIFNYNYQANPLSNDYIGKIGEIENVEAYLTSLLDTLNLNLQYEYVGNKESDLEYTYQILGKIQVFYEKNEEEQKVLEQEDILKQGNEEKVVSNGFKIDENLILDLKEKNTLLSSLKQSTGTNLNAKYIITLKVKTTTSIEGEIVENEFSNNITIDLGEKTTAIKGNEANETEYISKEYKEDVNGSFSIIIDVIGICIAILLFRFALKSQIKNIIKNEYRKELNKILKLCRDRIIETSSELTQNKNIVEIIDFGEMVKLSEDINEPILYYFDDNNENAYFYIINNNITYRFILRD